MGLDDCCAAGAPDRALHSALRRRCCHGSRAWPFRAVRRPYGALSGPADPMMAQITNLASLHAAGVLSDDEFAAAKAKVLGL